MLARLASFVVRRRRLTLIGVLVLTIAAAVFGGGVAKNLIAGGFEPAGAESVRADDLVEDTFGQVQPNVVLVVTATDGDVTSDPSRAAGAEITDFVAGYEHVDLAVSFWSLGDPPPLRGRGGDRALVLAHVEGTETRRSSGPTSWSMRSTPATSVAMPPRSTPAASRSSMPR